MLAWAVPQRFVGCPEFNTLLPTLTKDATWATASREVPMGNRLRERTYLSVKQAAVDMLPAICRYSTQEGSQYCAMSLQSCQYVHKSDTRLSKQHQRERS